MGKVKTETIKQEVIKNSIWNFFMSLIIKTGGLIFTILLARFLFPEKFGIYSLAMSIVMIFLTFADMGINASCTVKSVTS